VKATLIGFTSFNEVAAEKLTGWTTDTHSGQALVEFAGRACYQSWEKPNPETATNKAYIANILAQRHYSVLEHASATFYITGVSRSLTHELIRHRHLSYSELSQRFVNVEEAALVLPPAIPDDDEETLKDLAWLNVQAREVYKRLADTLLQRGKTRKQAREAARAVMPNALETRIVVTGNYRAWRHFLEMRGSEHADAEIRRLAVDIAWQFKQFAPNVFQDLHLRVGEDGSETLYFGEAQD
jgi:thymidylate synthase (FAD)